MALDAGVMSITVEFAKDLKDSDWFGKQDPYCIIKVGGQTFRTKTAVDGGRHPVWNETFRFNIINENDAELEIKDEDVGRDDLIGTATFSFARARATGSDRINVPVTSKKKKQHGFVSICLSWTSNHALTHPSGMCAPQMPMPYPGYQVMPGPMPTGQPVYYAQVPGGYGGHYPPAAPAQQPYR